MEIRSEYSPIMEFLDLDGPITRDVEDVSEMDREIDSVSEIVTEHNVESIIV